MRVLLDECVTRYVKRDLAGHEVLTVDEAGFKGLKNGRLLEAASGRYDVLITVDQNIRYQQNLKNFAGAVLVLKAKRSTYPALKPLMPQVLEAIEKARPGEVIILS